MGKYRIHFLVNLWDCEDVEADSLEEAKDYFYNEIYYRDIYRHGSLVLEAIDELEED